MKKTLIPIFTVALGLSANTFATDLLNDTFDSYVNQAAFVSAWPVVGAQPSGTLTTAQAITGNSIFNVGTTVAGEAMRNSANFTETGNPNAINNIIRFSFDFYDGDAAASPYRSHSNLQDGTAPGSYGQLVAMGLNNNQFVDDNGGNYYMGRILGYNPNETRATTAGAFFKLNLPGAPLRSTGWHNLAVEITDLAFSFYVDGILSEVVAQTGTLRSYDHVRLGSGVSNAGVGSYYDNVLISVNPVPEPSTIALGLIGGAGLAFGYIRRRANK